MTSEDLADAIDDLSDLLGESDDFGGGNAGDGAETGQEDFSKLNELINTECAVLSENWSTVSPAKVEFIPAPAVSMTVEEIANTFEETAIVAEISYEGEYAGATHLILTKEDALTGAGLLMMMEGDELNQKRNDDYTDDDADAYGELINVFVGNAIVQVKPLLDAQDLSLKKGDLTKADFAAGEPPVAEILKFSDYVVSEITLKIAEYPETKALRVFSKTFAGQLASGKQEGGLGFDFDGEFEGVEVGGGGSAEPVVKHEDAHENMERILNIDVPVIVELAAKKLRMEDIMNFCPGYIIQFEKRSDTNLDLMINNRKIAQGEVIIIGDRFGLQIKRITNIREKIKSLRGSA